MTKPPHSASNQSDANDQQPVVQVVGTSSQHNEIDSEILTAFAPMEVDLVFNPNHVDNDVETWDPYFTADSFVSLTNPRAWYNLEQVRVDFVWMEERKNTLYLKLRDKLGVKMAAEVPQDLVGAYRDREMAQTFVSINHFQVGYVDPTQYPCFQNYSFVRREWVILVNDKTEVNEILFADESGFCPYPWLPSIRSLVDDKTPTEMLIDTIGRVVSGGLKKPEGLSRCEIWLRDVTCGNKVCSVSYVEKCGIRMAKAINEKGTIYLQRVKLVHTASLNLLVDTEITSLEFDPDMRMAKALMKIKI